MPYLELTLACTEAAQPRLELALEDIGALSVTLMDANADAPDEQAIFEPGVGEQPLWRTMTLTALFAHGTAPDLVLLALGAVDEDIDLSTAQFRDVADEDWERAWMDQFKPMRFGRRLWIYPWNIDPPADPALAIVRLDPGMAFGTGTHPTTALCLEWLDAADLAGRRVIDFGCGSGVLAIAALKLGAAEVAGIDNDPQAITASRDNAERNGVADRLALSLPEAFDDRPAEVFVANILAGPLAELAPRFAACVVPGGALALSGILHGQHEDLLVRYAEWFDELSVAVREDWVRISGRRR